MSARTIGVWEDTSSHGRGATDRTPNTWTLRVTSSLSVVIHRHIHHAPDDWLFSCNTLSVSAEKLRSKDIGLAKKEALEIVERMLADWLNAVQKCQDATN